MFWILCCVSCPLLPASCLFSIYMCARVPFPSTSPIHMCARVLSPSTFSFYMLGRVLFGCAFLSLLFGVLFGILFGVLFGFAFSGRFCPEYFLEYSGFGPFCSEYFFDYFLAKSNSKSIPESTRSLLKSALRECCEALMVFLQLRGARGPEEFQEPLEVPEVTEGCPRPPSVQGRV